jgi:hypothetical protein
MSCIVEEKELVKSICQESLYEFVKEAWPHIEPCDYIDGFHVAAISEHLQAVTEGNIANLLINIPPGCSKSLMAAVFWPVWEWIKIPLSDGFFPVMIKGYPLGTL